MHQRDFRLLTARITLAAPLALTNGRAGAADMPAPGLPDAQRRTAAPRSAPPRPAPARRSAR